MASEPRLTHIAPLAANILSLVNDSRALLRSGCPAPAPRCDNCAFVELHLQGWPVIALVTTAPVSLGEELLASHGPQYWDYVKDAQGRLNQVLRRTGTAAVAAPAAAAPAVETVSEAHGDSAAVPAASVRASRHVLQVDGKAKCAVVVTAQGGAASAAVPPFPAAFALNVTATTSGDNAATSIKPLLASGAWDGQPLLVSGASPSDVAKLASLAATLDKKGKAAFVVDCDGGTQADAGRRLYFVPAGRVADAVLSGLPAAALALPPGSFIALVFAPARRVAAPVAAPAAEQVGTASADSAAMNLSSRSHAAKPPAPAPTPAPALDRPPVAAAEWYCPTCGFVNGAFLRSCHRCRFLPVAMPAAQQTTSTEREELAAYLGRLVKVLRSSKPHSLPMSMPRLNVRAFEDHNRTKTPVSVANRYGTLLALLQAHDDIFAVELSADDDPRTPGSVRLRASATPDPVLEPCLPSSHQPPHDGAADSWTCPTCGYGNPALLSTCHRCCFLPAAVTTARPACTAIDKYEQQAYLCSLVAVLRRASDKQGHGSMDLPRLRANVDAERKGLKVPASVAYRYGTLLSLLQAHDDTFTVETSADERPCMRGRVQLRARAAPPDPVWKPRSPPSHPPLASPRLLPPQGGSVDAWTCQTCDLKLVPDCVQHCSRCKWQRGPTSADVQATMHNSPTDLAEQNRFAVALVATLRRSPSGTYLIRKLSYDVWNILRDRAPQSAVARYGTLAAFLAARPGDFKLLPPSASLPSVSPANALVALADRDIVPVPVSEPSLPSSHPPLASPRSSPPHGISAHPWTCLTCDFQTPDSLRFCKRCVWQREPTSAAVQASTHNTAAETAEQDGYAETIVTFIRGSDSRKYAIGALSRDIWCRLQLRPPQSAVLRYGTLAAFIAARPADFHFLPLSAYLGAGSSKPAYALVGLTARARFGDSAPPALALPPPQPLPPASNQVLSAAHLTSLLLQLKRAAEGGESPPAKAARFEDAPRRS